MTATTSGARAALALCVALVVATALAFGLHVALSAQITPWVSEVMQHHKVIKPPYPAWLLVLAALTAVIPMATTALVLLLLYERLPGRGPFVKGIVFGIIQLALKGTLRNMIMDLAIGNPARVVLVQSSEAWSITLSTSIVLAYGISFWRLGRPSHSVDPPDLARSAST
jgi:MFS family permease